MLQLAKMILAGIETITPTQIKEVEQNLREIFDYEFNLKPKGVLSIELQKFYTFIEQLKKQIRASPEKDKETLRELKIDMEDFLNKSIIEQFKLERNAEVRVKSGWEVFYHPPYCEEYYTSHSPREKCPPHIRREPIITERGQMGGASPTKKY